MILDTINWLKRKLTEHFTYFNISRFKITELHHHYFKIPESYFFKYQYICRPMLDCLSDINKPDSCRYL